jgi:hypothetical protein
MSEDVLKLYAGEIEYHSDLNYSESLCINGLAAEVRALRPMAQLGQFAVAWYGANRELDEERTRIYKLPDNYVAFEAARRAACAAEQALEDAIFALMKPKETPC